MPNLFAARGPEQPIETSDVFQPKFDADGLIPAIVTDRGTGTVLMFAFMDATALRLTLDTGLAHFWSRSRKKIWKKGEESGNMLAVGEIRLRDWASVFRRELISGAILGVILGSIGFLRIALWSAFSNIYGEHWLLVALTVGIALIGIVLWGTLSGSMLPILLRRLGFDPAASSAPFVATLVDVTGLVIYFSVAAVILRGTLL